MQVARKSRKQNRRQVALPTPPPVPRVGGPVGIRRGRKQHRRLVHAPEDLAIIVAQRRRAVPMFPDVGVLDGTARRRPTPKLIPNGRLGATSFAVKRDVTLNWELDEDAEPDDSETEVWRIAGDLDKEVEDNWELIATVEPDLLTYIDEGRPRGEWCYRVRGAFADFEIYSEFSNVACSLVTVNLSRTTVTPTGPRSATVTPVGPRSIRITR